MKSQEPKRSYRIGEVSRLFGIGIDSLRYYERRGIIHPRRAANGYRTYDLNDMYKLSLIKDLRRFDFSMEQIGMYLDEQHVEKTRDLLARERAYIDARILELEMRRDTIALKLETLDEAQSARTQTISIEHRGLRRCVELAAHLERDEEMDLAIQRLHRRYEEELPHLSGMSIGAFLSRTAIEAGNTNIYESVFFVVDDEHVESEFDLPAGNYLCLSYRGSYAQNGALVRRMLEHATREGLELAGDPFELYLIDNRDTSREEEFLTRIEIPIRARKGCGSA